MKKQNTLKKLLVIPALLVAVMVVLATAFPAKMQENERETAASGAGYSTGLIGITPGQTVRIAAVNQDDKAIEVEFALVDDKGNVQLLCNEIVDPGKAVYEDFQHPGGANRLELHAQVRARNSNDLEELVPSLQVIEGDANRTVMALSGFDFVSFRPVFNPPSRF